MKVQFNIRLPEETVDLIDRLRAHLGGMSQADLVSLAIAKLARVELRDGKRKEEKNKPPPLS